MAPRTVDVEARRSRLLAAAAAVFARHGYQQTTIGQIAEAAGVAKGSVYLAFDSKEDLFFGLFEELTRDVVGSELDPSAESSQHVLDRLAQALYRIAEAVDQDESIIPLTLEFWSVCGVEQTRERFGQRYAESLGDFRSRIVELLEHGQARGEVDPEAPLEAVASCLIAIVDGLFIQQWTVPETRVSATLKEALPIVLRSLRRQDTHA